MPPDFRVRQEIGTPMRTVVAYESMYGNTRQIAEAIADGASRVGKVSLVTAAELSHATVADAGLLIVGGPTHVHSMSSPRTRQGAVEAAAKATPPLALEEFAGAGGLREWFASGPQLP